MDKRKTKMIDYKNFLAIMNGNASIIESEKFDWAEEVLAKIRSWAKQSQLTIEDSFRIVDYDGDTYVKEKDLQRFLI